MSTYHIRKSITKLMVF